MQSIAHVGKWRRVRRGLLNPRIAPPTPGCRVTEGFWRSTRRTRNRSRSHGDLGRREDYVEPLLGRGLLGIPYSIAVAHPTADVATCRPRQRRDTTASFAKSASSESNARCRHCDQFCFRTCERSAKSLAGCAGKMAEGPQTSAWIPRSSFIWCSNGDGVDPSPLRWSFSAFGCSPN